MITYAANTDGYEEWSRAFSGALYVLLSLKKSLLRSNNMRSRIIVMVVALLAAAAFPAGGWAQRGQGGGGQGAQGGQARGGQRQGAAAAPAPEGPADAARRFGNQQAAASVPFPPGWRPCPRCQNNADRARDNQINRTEGHPYNPHDLTGTWGWDGISNAFRDGKGPALTAEGKKLFDDDHR